MVNITDSATVLKERDLPTTLSDRPNQPFTDKADPAGPRSNWSGTLIDGLLVPDQGPLMVKPGSSFPHDAIKYITIKDDQWHIIWRYQIQVYAYAGRTFGLDLTDEEGDTYHLTVCSPIGGLHFVNYNSNKPAICKVKYDIAMV
ncbi:MAG TPA: hypothetical protein VGK06_13185 [Methanosarcina sp.]|jgi:hypothetical protein